jgi:pimeloyl-ACP methyl ester carboxylesterase
MMTRRRKIMTIVLIILAVIATVTVAGTVYRTALVRPRKEGILPYGKLVDVEGKRMHVRTMGSGPETIVLLPGMGVALPSADFAPLMRALAGKHTVVTVEYFGTGFSQTADRPRTSVNYVQEIRTALAEAGYAAPYVLMPHSISGVYAEHYAFLYPEEVRAIISLDGSPTVYYEPLPSYMKLILSFAQFQQAVGTTSILAPLATNRKSLLVSGYTSEELDHIITFAGFVLNDTVVEQILNSSEVVREVMDLPFPASVPYFKIISNQTWEKPVKQLPMGPQEYQLQHLERIGSHARYEVLEGSHFIYLNNAERIAQIADEVIAGAVPEAQR